MVDGQSFTGSFELVNDWSESLNIHINVINVLELEINELRLRLILKDRGL